MFVGCHYKVLGDTGHITSPKFDTPKHNSRYSNCSWLVTVDDVYVVAFNMSFLKLREDDVIEVYDGRDENTPLLAFYSRFNISEDNGSFLSSSNNIFILLKYGTSSSYQTHFALEYGSHPRPTGICVCRFINITYNFHRYRRFKLLTFPR